MNHYIMIRRLMGPAILLLLGTVALLHQAHLVGWVIFFPLLLILIGLLQLAERAALAEAGYPNIPQPGMNSQAVPNSPAAEPNATQPAGTAIVPAPPTDLNNTNGGQA
jgi:hypothetical protein